VLVCSERKVLLAGCWFVPRGKYCWLVADKPSEQGVELNGPNKKWRNDERTAFQICVR
jgi:hypothetical protein